MNIIKAAMKLSFPLDIDTGYFLPQKLPGEIERDEHKVDRVSLRGQRCKKKKTNLRFFSQFIV